MLDIGTVVMHKKHMILGIIKSKKIKVTIGDSIVKCYVVDLGEYDLQVFPCDELESGKDVFICEKRILSRLYGCCKYLTRHKDGLLYIHEKEPKKLEEEGIWISSRNGRDYGCGDCFDNFHQFFQYIKWKDEKPTLIADLLNS
jgi:hypothetical protein